MSASWFNRMHWCSTDGGCDFKTSLEYQLLSALDSSSRWGKNDKTARHPKKLATTVGSEHLANSKIFWNIICASSDLTSGDKNLKWATRPRDHGNGGWSGFCSSLIISRSPSSNWTMSRKSSWNRPVSTPRWAAVVDIKRRYSRTSAQRVAWLKMGLGGDLVVSILAFYSDDPSSNPAGYLNFLYKKTK